jgi:hypothetical protein
MNIFNNLDIVYEICIQLNFFERLHFGNTCHTYYQIVYNINKNHDIKNEIFKHYNINTHMENYKIEKLPFVKNFFDILIHKYDAYFNNYPPRHVKIKIDGVQVLIYKSGYILLNCNKLNNLNAVYQLYEQLYQDGVLLYPIKNVKETLHLITKTCSLKLSNINSHIINQLNTIHHELYNHWFLLYQYFKYNDQNIPFDIFKYIIKYYMYINTFYTINKKQFKNCQTVYFMYNQYKGIGYKLFGNGSVRFSYNHFNHFFKTFKLLLTSIKKLN